MMHKTIIACIVLLVFGVSCAKKQTQTPLPSVNVVQVQKKDVPLYGEWVGTLDGMINADIRSQVSGYLLARNYIEGSFVKKGTILFEIDPRPFRAVLDQARGILAQGEGQLAQATSQRLQAEAQLTQAKANQLKTQLDVNKYVPLGQQKAVTQQDVDNALQANAAALAQIKVAKSQIGIAQAAIVAAKAQIESAKAQVETANLNLEFTHVVSLIDGIAGIAQAQVGDLVSPSSGILASVSKVNPIRAYFTMSEQEYLNYQENNLKTNPFELILANGKVYPYRGKFLAVDRSVSVNTGAIRVAATFPNPGNKLRPGQYARVRAITDIKAGALLVPQSAVSQLQDYDQVAIVENNKINIRNVQVGKSIGTMRIINQGLKDGETIVVDGTQKVRQDMSVSPQSVVCCK